VGDSPKLAKTVTKVATCQGLSIPNNGGLSRVRTYDQGIMRHLPNLTKGPSLKAFVNFAFATDNVTDNMDALFLIGAE
jgi:hypothetical protein